jgi:hypothetical protein
VHLAGQGTLLCDLSLDTRHRASVRSDLPAATEMGTFPANAGHPRRLIARNADKDEEQGCFAKSLRMKDEETAKGADGGDLKSLVAKYGKVELSSFGTSVFCDALGFTFLLITTGRNPQVALLSHVTIQGLAYAVVGAN